MPRSLVLLCLVAVAGCATDFQTTSGAAYLAAGGISDPTIAAAASAEPRLSFPARIGVVRLVYYRVSPIPARERALYDGLVARSSGFGEFVHLGALESRVADRTPFVSVDHDLRRLAASRHLDYLLVLSLDPERNSAEALMLDVRTGYPYASTQVSPPGRSRTGFFGGRINSPRRLDAATLRLARALTPELETMFAGLAERAG